MFRVLAVLFGDDLLWSALLWTGLKEFDPAG
jgi:hypothetical protein